MKKYLFGLCSFIVAAILASFSQPEKSDNRFVDYIFQFDIANNSPTKANVENPSKWLLVADTTGCPRANQKACKIKVPESATEDNSPDPRTLKSTADIDATQYNMTGVYYVSGGSSLLQALNRTN